MAEDLVQEAFLALCRKSAVGEDVRDPRHWTLCVIRHQMSKHLRDQERHGEELLPREVLEAMPAGERPAPPDQPADMGRLLRVLTRREREVIVLRLQSQKHQQIAARLGISPKTTAALLARALRKLQKTVAKEASDEWPALLHRGIGCSP